MKLRTIAAAAGLAWAALLAFGCTAGRPVDSKAPAEIWRGGPNRARGGGAVATRNDDAEWRWVPYNVCGSAVMVRVKASGVAPPLGWAAIIAGIEDGVLLGPDTRGDER